MFDAGAPRPKRTRNHKRFKHIDKRIEQMFEYCRQRGVILGGEGDIYGWFKRTQEIEFGYATPAHDMAEISANVAQEKYDYHLVTQRLRHGHFPFKLENGRVVSLRRYMPLGILGWRDVKKTAEAAQTEEDYLQLAQGLAAAAEQATKWARQCSSLITQAEAFNEAADRPRLLFLAAPETEEDNNGDDAE